MAFKVREAHWEVLLDYMSNHKDFARGKFIGAQGRESQKKMWVALANKLNSLGFGEKSPDKWQKTWTDFKYQIKKKGASIRIEQNKTGGGTPTYTPFNSVELRALEILGGNEFYAGVGSEEVGISLVSRYNPDVPSTSHQSMSSIQDVSDHEGDNAVLEASNKKKLSITLDHNYDDPPRKRQKITNEKVYEETIIILKDIKNSLDSLTSVVDSRLSQIAEASSQKK